MATLIRLQLLFRIARNPIPLSANAVCSYFKNAQLSLAGSSVFWVARLFVTQGIPLEDRCLGQKSASFCQRHNLSRVALKETTYSPWLRKSRCYLPGKAHKASEWGATWRSSFLLQLTYFRKRMTFSGAS